MERVYRISKMLNALFGQNIGDNVAIPWRPSHKTIVLCSYVEPLEANMGARIVGE
jgi:hypothetical protein